MRRMTKEILVEYLNKGIDPREEFIDHLLNLSIYTAEYQGSTRFYAYRDHIQRLATHVEKHKIREIV